MVNSHALVEVVCAQAWRAVDRAYVDKGFNGQSWFRVGGGWSRAWHEAGLARRVNRHRAS